MVIKTPANPIDTVGRQLGQLTDRLNKIDVQHAALADALETLNQHNSYDLYVRAGTVLITALSILIAFRLFYLNKKKEFHIKKSEIVGEIYARIHEFKRLKIIVMEHGMRNKALLTFFLKKTGNTPLTDDIILRVKINFGIFREDDQNIKAQKSEEELNTLRRELQKYIGQYRYFVGESEKAALKFHSNAISQTYPIKEVLIDKSIDEVLNSYADVMEEAVNKEKAVIEKQFYALEGIIDNYEKYIKSVDLYES